MLKRLDDLYHELFTPLELPKLKSSIVIITG